MKKFLSVALSLVMLFTATTFNGSCAFEGSQMGETQKVVNTQARRRRNVNFKEQKQESGFENFKAKASKALKSTGRAIVGAAKVAGEFVVENANPIAIVGLGVAGAASTTWVGVNAYKNRENIKAAYNDKELSKQQKTKDILKLLFGIKAKVKEEPKNDNGNKEQPSNGSNENTANNENSASQDNADNKNNNNNGGKTNKEEQSKQKGKLYCATHLEECANALNAQAEAVAKAKKEAEDKAAQAQAEAVAKAKKEYTALKVQVETLRKKLMNCENNAKKNNEQ